MAHRDKYLTCLEAAIRQAHHCGAVHSHTVSVRETIGEQTIWEGDVEVFDIQGHAEATKCYAWLYHEQGSERFVTVLENQLVNSAKMAVRQAIFFDLQPAPYPRPDPPS